MRKLDVWDLFLGASVAALTLVVAASGSFRSAWQRFNKEVDPSEQLLDATRREATAADRSARTAAEHAESVRRQLEILQQGIAANTEVPQGTTNPLTTFSQPNTSIDIEIMGGSGQTNPDSGLREVEIVLLFLSERPIFNLEFALIGPSWKRDSQSVNLNDAGQAGMWSFMQVLVPTDLPDDSWTEFIDQNGRHYPCPEPPPTEREAWAILSFDREYEGSYSIWQRVTADASKPEIFVGESIGNQHTIQGTSPGAGS